MFENKENRTDLSAIGEFGLIDHITKNVSLKNASSLKGIGDDAAIIDNGNKMTVVSTDMLVEGVHFDLTFQPLKHLGYKAVMVNLSDIYAMNATPHQITVSIALSNRFSLEAIEEFYVGIFMACERHGVDLVGGDTTSSVSGLIISVTVIGTADKEEIVYRNTAGINDLICVSGDLGGAYIGLQLLEREKKIFIDNPKIQPDLQGNDYILERQLKPEARGDVIARLREQKIKPTAMIDISDGLSSDLLHICKQSDVGAAIYEEKIPIDVETFNAATEFNLNPLVCALNGGEDYELLFTIKQDDYEKIKSIKEVTVIGHITEKNAGVNLIDKAAGMHPITAQGWDALLKQEP